MSNIFTRPSLPIMFRVRADVLLGCLGSASQLYLGGFPWFHGHPGLSVQAHRAFCCPWTVTLPQGWAVPQSDVAPPREQNTLDPPFTSFVKSQALSWLFCPPIYNLTSVLLLCFITPGPLFSCLANNVLLASLMIIYILHQNISSKGGVFKFCLLFHHLCITSARDIVGPQ